MKAIVLKEFGGVNNLKFESLPMPVRKPGEVLVKIKAAAFNPIDYQMRSGMQESRLMRSPILGREFAGIVVETGTDAERFKVGDEVLALAGSMGSNGSYAEYIALNEQLLAKKPDSITFEQAAAIPSSGLTAWECFYRAGIKTDESIFITGASGGVGRFFIKLLKYGGINHIVVTAGNDQSMAALIKLGIESNAILDYRRSDVENAAMLANKGHKFDYSANIAGGTASEIAACVLKIYGNYIDVTYQDTENTKRSLFDLSCKVYNIAAYTHALAGNFEWYGTTLGSVCDLLLTNKITPPAINIIGGFSQETAREAHLLMEENKTFGKKLVMSF